MKLWVAADELNMKLQTLTKKLFGYYWQNIYLFSLTDCSLFISNSFRIKSYIIWKNPSLFISLITLGGIQETRSTPFSVGFLLLAQSCPKSSQMALPLLAQPLHCEGLRNKDVSNTASLCIASLGWRSTFLKASSKQLGSLWDIMITMTAYFVLEAFWCIYVQDHFRWKSCLLQLVFQELLLCVLFSLNSHLLGKEVRGQVILQKYIRLTKRQGHLYNGWHLKWLLELCTIL